MPKLCLFCLLAAGFGVAVMCPLPMAAQNQVVEVKPMAKDAHPSFDVATVRRTDPDDHSAGFHTDGRQIFIENETMRSLLSFAYGLQAKQIVGAPDWFTAEHWDIKGFADADGQPNTRQQQEMLRKLLAERFHLTTHRDKRDMGIFTISALSEAQKLKVNPADSNLPDQTGSNDRSLQDWRFTSNSMNDFAQFLQYFLDRPVVDHTGLPAKYDFHLKWSTGDAAAEATDATIPGIYTAMREQLGLKLESTHGEVDVLVIDSIQKPAVD